MAKIYYIFHLYNLGSPWTFHVFEGVWHSLFLSIIPRTLHTTQRVYLRFCWLKIFHELSDRVLKIRIQDLCLPAFILMLPPPDPSSRPRSISCSISGSTSMLNRCVALKFIKKLHVVDNNIYEFCSDEDPHCSNADPLNLMNADPDPVQ